MAAVVESSSKIAEKPNKETVSEVLKDSKVKLEELKVVDLKNELEKRELDKTGVKSVLVERLKAALIKEGKNPDEYSFEINTEGTLSKAQSKKKKVDREETNQNQTVNEDVSQENASKDDISQEIANESNSLEDANEDIAKENEDIVQENADEGIPKENANEDIPKDNVNEDISHENASKDIPQENASKDIPQENARKDIPQENASKDIPQENASKDIPQENASKDIPQENASKDIPQENASKDIPQENASKDIPRENVRKDAISQEDASENAVSLKDASENAMSKDDASENVNSQEDVNEDVISQEEKVEITLQLSIDEEEAQLNEESLIDGSKEDGKHGDADIECDSLEKNVAVENKVEGSKSNVSKSAKTTVVEPKEKKVLKTVALTKTSDVVSTVSPKVLQVIGKNEKLRNPTVLAKSLWITGLQNTTRAADLTALFSKQGRVLSVKIVKSAKQNTSKCYGFVTMSTNKDATKAIQNLNHTELNGQKITVERAQNEPSTLLKKSESKIAAKKHVLKKEISTTKATNESKVTTVKEKSTNKAESKSVESVKQVSGDSGEKKVEKTGSSEKLKFKDRDKKSRERRDKERDLHRSVRRPVGYRPRSSFPLNDRSRYGGFRKPFGRPFSNRVGFASNFRSRPNIITMSKLREDRYPTEKFHEREVERRRDDELSRHRYIERKQREEAYRLEREKERLRLEREMLERERAELLKLEREKQRLERERLERERDELRRQAELGRSMKRPFSRVEREPEMWDVRKKSSRYETRPNFHAEPPHTPAYDFPPRDRPSFGREVGRHSERFNPAKPLDVIPRAEFGDREARREVSIRTREERQVFARSDFRERDTRRGFSSKERERHSTRREPPRDEWKQERRIHERIISPSNSIGHRRMAYY